MNKNIELFKALSNENRLNVLYWLKDPTKYFVHNTNVDMEKIGVCVGELQKKMGVTQSTTSHYLTMLEKVDLLVSTRIGKWTYYRRNEETIKTLCNFIKKDL